MINYSDITFNDPNAIKRWLQYKRLKTSIKLSSKFFNPINKYSICDYGAGNGELCKLLSNNIVIGVSTDELNEKKK